MSHNPKGFLVSAFLLAACATTRPPAWVPAVTPYLAPKTGFQMSIPDGWMRLNDGRDERVLITRDGSALQRIWAEASAVGQPPGFGDSKRRVTEEMSPSEAAKLIVDSLSSTRTWTEVRVLENSLASLSGRPAFRLVAAFRDENGLKTRLAMYGTVASGQLYQVVYIAPERYYFPLDLANFEQIVSSFHIGRGPATEQAKPSTGAAEIRDK